MNPLEVHSDPDGGTNNMLVYEGFNPDDAKEEHCVTIVATVNGVRGSAPDLYEGENIADWAAYMAAFSADTPQDMRIEHCRRRGNKLPEEVAVAIFPRLKVGRYRR